MLLLKPYTRLPNPRCRPPSANPSAQPSAQPNHTPKTMGCSSSTPAKHRTLPKPPPVRQNTNGALSKPEIDSRIEFGETVEKTFGGVKVRYAFLSQRGYYPDGKCCSVLR